MTDQWKRRGGQEPPPEAQDRPEQNRGYDEAVRGGPLTPNEQVPTDDLVPAPPEDQAGIEEKTIDEREADPAARDVRRRERSADS